MRAGKLRHRITLESRQFTRNQVGDAVVSWLSLDPIWGSVEPMANRYREFYTAAGMSAEKFVLIRIRWRAGVTETDRVIWQGHIYNIVAVIDQQTNYRELHLICTEGLTDGR